MKKIKVMIADDFSLLLDDMSEIINSQPDMQVVGKATSGREIITLAQNRTYDIILMDIEMEDTVAGIEATRVIREKNNSAKIIFITAHETNNIILSAMATGAVDYIVKGMPENEILEHIRSAYEGKSLMDGKIKEVIMQEYRRLKQSEESLLFFIHNLSDLTEAEREIIRLLLKDKKVREIAEERSVELVTVKTQISSLLKKLGERRTKAIVKKIRDLNLTHLFERELN